MGFNVRGGGGAISEINVTPLVDVMLVLLIIFMVTATLLKHRDESERLVEMELPVTRDNPAVVDVQNTDRLILRIEPDLKTFVGDELITDCSAALASTVPQRFEPCFDEIQLKLGQNARLQAEHEIYILADANIPYGYVVGTLYRLRQAGADQVGMVTNPEYIRDLPPTAPGPVTP
jgi:biopolymer transport protein TolR